MAEHLTPSRQRPRKAMVLAAGLGTRLKPLTDHLPKPLLPVAGLPLIRYALKLLARHGIAQVMINLHHLPDKIEAELGRKAEGLRIQYSREPEILGTGGGIRKVAAFLDEPFVLINADALIDLDLGAAINTHLRMEALATMVLKPKGPTDSYTTVGVDADGRVRQIGDRVPYDGPALAPHFFTGVHIIEPELLDYIPPDIASCINGYAYPKVLADDRIIAAHVHEGLFVDVGTLNRYWQINADFLSGAARINNMDPLAAFEHHPHNPVDELVCLGSKVSLGDNVHIKPPVVIGNGVRIGENCVIGPEVIIDAGSSIGKGSQIQHSLILAGTKIDAGDKLCETICLKKLRVPHRTQTQAVQTHLQQKG